MAQEKSPSSYGHGAGKDKVRRATSLKSGRTPPPSSPSRRKIVRFADVFGLDLADVRTFLDEVPRVPRCAFTDLKDIHLDSSTSSSDNEDVSSGQCQTISLVPVFAQPGTSSNFTDTVKSKKVCVESLFSQGRSVRGSIRVLNMSFEKKVVVRFTTDEWTTADQVTAEFLKASGDRTSDTFVFCLPSDLPLTETGQRLQLCVRYQCASRVFWDNHDGNNYIFQCIANPAKASSSRGVPIKREPLVAADARRLFAMQPAVFSCSPSALMEDPWFRYL